MIVEQPEAFQTWLTAVLKPMCDADPATLAKYVIALIKKDKADDELRKSMIGQLKVFLEEETETFVNLVFQTLQSQEYISTLVIPNANPPNPNIVQLGNMANVENVVKELDRLKKTELIDIIIKKKVPDDKRVSDVVRKYIDDWKGEKFSNSTCDSDSEDVGLEVPAILKYELKCANTEIQYLKKLNSELEKTILDKELIIKLINKEHNLRNDEPGRCDIADVTNSAATTGKNTCEEAMYVQEEVLAALRALLRP